MRWLFLIAGALAGCSSSGGGTDSAGSSGELTEGTGTESTALATGEATSTTTTATASSQPSTDPTTADPSGDPSTDPPTSEPTTAEPATSSATSSDTGDDTGEPAGGCGKVPDVTGSSPQKITAAGIERDYILSLPADYDPAKAYPLVFAWHGRGGSGGLAQLYFKVEEASQGQAIFVYPDGLPLADMADQTGWDLDPNNEDFALFDALLTDVQSRLCVDPGRVFSTGHSFGGYMSNQIGCFRGEVVRAIGLVAGGGPFGSCVGEVAAWLAHGNVDTVVPFSEGENSRDHWTAANSCAAAAEPVDPAPCTAFTGCDDGFPVTWCEHSEPALGGHGWPDWAGPGIWGFFAQF